MVGVILAAGDGKRLKSSSGKEYCKPVTEINNKKLITYSLDQLRALHVDEVYIVIGKEGDLIKEALGDTYKGIKLYYVYQSEQKGLIHAFMQALNAMPRTEPVLLQLADEIFANPAIELIKKTVDIGKYDFYCGVTIEDDFEKIRQNYSVAVTEDAAILQCTEKPTKKINNLKGTGFCIFNSQTLQLLLNKYDKAANSPCDLCDYINWLISQNYKGLALCIAEKEFNINTYADLEDATTHLQQNNKNTLQ